MEKIDRLNLTELLNEELINIDGGKNLLEYAAFYVGRACKWIGENSCYTGNGAAFIIR